MRHVSLKITLANGDIAEWDLDEANGDDFDFDEDNCFFVVSKNDGATALYSPNHIVSIVFNR